MTEINAGTQRTKKKKTMYRKRKTQRTKRKK